ncbi:MAG: hypothetical protein ACOC97_03560 [Myxococcota bacterium]
MTSLKQSSFRAVLFVSFVALAVPACGGGSGNAGSEDAGSEDAGSDADAPVDASPDGTLPADGAAIDASDQEPVYWADVSAIFAARDCNRCHVGTENTYDSVVENWIEGEDGDVLSPMMEIGHKIQPDHADTVLHWLETGYPED